MSDTPDSDSYTPAAALPPPVASVPLPAPPRRRSGFGWLIALVLLAGLAAAGYWVLQSMQARSGSLASMVETQNARLDAAFADADRRNAALLDAQKTLETRLADAIATNKVLREELLAMGERASLLEDAVARLADNRLRGEVMLRLNEAEFLLMLGEERLRLFGDVPAAIQAYTLADAALAGVDDPVMATLRQTLAAELLALRGIPADARPALRAELVQLASSLPALPPSRTGEVQAADSNDSRLMRLLAGLVTVRRVSERDTVLGPVQRETTLAALRLQLELAQAALARPDVEAFRHSLDAATALSIQLFDARDEQVTRLAERLRALRETTLVPELPALGATLQELRGLRAARSVGALERALPEFAPVARRDDADPATAEDRDVEGGE